MSLLLQPDDTLIKGMKINNADNYVSIFVCIGKFNDENSSNKLYTIFNIIFSKVLGNFIYNNENGSLTTFMFAFLFFIQHISYFSLI